VDGDDLLVLGPSSSSQETIGSVVRSDDTTCTGLVVVVDVAVGVSVIVVAVSVRIAISAGISLFVVIGDGDSVAVVIVVGGTLVVVGTIEFVPLSSLLSPLASLHSYSG